MAKSRKTGKRSIGLMAALLMGAVLAIAAFLLIALKAHVNSYLGLPDPVLPTLGAGNNQSSEGPRHTIAVKQISPNMIQALLSAEDHHFYQHHGIDAIGLLRATLDNVKAGRMVEGGSTITQQLAKNVFLDWRDRSAPRKFKEWILAWELEDRYSKNAILGAYLNCVYFGSGAYGVEDAAKTYFGISASKLTISQSAYLAALLKAPSDLSVPSNRDDAIARQQAILDNMLQYGYLNEEQCRKAKSQKLKIIPFAPNEVQPPRQ